MYKNVEMKDNFRVPFLLRNIPKEKRENIRDKIKIKTLEKDLEFYQSIFKTHHNSAVFNLRIKTTNGQRLWVDRIRVYTDYELLNRLDEDEEVKEWKKPIRCER